MPRPRRVKRYPREFWGLFEKALTEKVVVNLRSKASARGLRAELYTFRSTVTSEEHRHQLTADEVKLVKEMHKVKLRVTSDGLLIASCEGTVKTLAEILGGSSDGRHSVS